MDVSGYMMPVQGEMGGAPYPPHVDGTNYQVYGVDSYLGSNFLQGNAPLALSQNPVDPMVEIGLTSESGIDEGWLSFMRECGIMDNGRPRC
jgi:hypothetical protein